MAKGVSAEKITESVSPALVAQSLVDLDFFALPDEDGDKVKLGYHSVLFKPEKVEEYKYFFRCEFIVKKLNIESKQDVQFVTASYACMMELGENDDSVIQNRAKDYVSTSAWNAFSSLFGLITHQMRVTFPPLPSWPGDIEVSEKSSFQEPGELEPEDA